MLVNRAIERWRRRDLTALADRFAHRRERRPLVLVPSILGTRIADGDRVLWGNVSRLYFGPSITRTAPSRAAGLLDGFTVVPRLYSYDVYGGLVRALERIGGYRRGHDLFVLEYDWRESVRDGADRLAELVDLARGRHGGCADLIAVSSGGLVVRHLLARGLAQVGRAIYVGTPHRGTFQSLSMLHAGVQMVPFGKRFSAEEVAHCKTAWDSMPHPDDAVFVDERGAAVERSLYDPATWRDLRLGWPAAAVEEHLERACSLHRLLDAAPVHGDSVVIGARHLPTLTKVVVRASRATIPDCSPTRGDPIAHRLFEPGDSALPSYSLQALPGLDPRRIHWVTPAVHHRLPSEPEVHRIALEALL